MLTHLQKIKKVGCYDEYKFDAKISKPFNSINIMYGNNGSGKTTLSNIFFLASKHCKGKDYLLKELIDDDSELEIALEVGKITHKNILEKNLDLYVFNSKFIADHVYNGTIANIDSFSSDIKLTSPEILMIDESLDRVGKRLSKFENWKSLMEFKLESIFKVFNDEFQKKVSGFRLTGVKPALHTVGVGDPTILRTELDLLYKDYSNKSKEGNTIDKYNQLKLKLESVFNLGLDTNQLTTALTRKISLEAKSKIAQRINNLETYVERKGQQASVGDLNDWFRKGGRLLFFSKGLDNHCPLCDSDITVNIDAIINDFGSYFSTSILGLFEILDSSISALEFFSKGNLQKKNVIAIDDFIATARVTHGIQVQSFYYPEENNDLLLSSLNTLLELIKQKKQNPELELEISQNDLDLINSYILAIEEFKKKSSESIDQEIAILQAVSLDSIVKKIKTKISQLVSVELNETSNLIFVSKKRINADIAQRIEFLQTEAKKIILAQELLRAEEISKLNAESKYINLYLKSLGIDHFNVDKVKEKSQDNLVITYAKTGKTKNQLSHSLSEGEKTALAFAYFISKLRVEKIESEGNGFKNCIIVIDDPISSLDDQRLFQTANLIDSFLFYNIKAEDGDSTSTNHYPAQVFILSHNLTFIKYLHNAISRYSDESTPVFRAKVPHLFRSKVRQPDRPSISTMKA